MADSPNCMISLASGFKHDLQYYLLRIFFILQNKNDDESSILFEFFAMLYEPVYEISNNVVCATSKASDQPAHTHSLIRAFASSLSIL